MAVKKFTLTIDNVKSIANEILTMEPTSLKRWNKNPRLARGEDLATIIAAHFEDANEDNILWTALWVDIYLTVKNSCRCTENEWVVLLSHEETIEALMAKAKSDPGYFEFEIEWVQQFGCLLTEGSGSDIGAWFYDPLWDRLFEVHAMAWFDDIYVDGSSISNLEKFAKSESPLDRAGVARNENTPTKLLTMLSKDPSQGIRFLVALNSNTPAEVLETLVQDEVEEVREAAKENESA
jgi:hypothetical protein